MINSKQIIERLKWNAEQLQNIENMVVEMKKISLGNGNMKAYRIYQDIDTKYRENLFNVKAAMTNILEMEDTKWKEMCVEPINKLTNLYKKWLQEIKDMVKS